MAIDTSDFDKDRAIWEKTIREIRRECQPYLTQVKYPFHLYRGMRQTYKVIKKTVRLDDRRPTEMDTKDHETINDFFTSAFGAPFRNALFTTGDADHAGYFGTVYSIFPIGKFEFLWSPQIDDLNFHMHDLLDGLYADRDSPVPPTPRDREQALYMALQDVDWRTTDLQAAIEAHVEISIRCNSYYALPIEMIDATGMVTPLWDILDERL